MSKKNVVKLIKWILIFMIISSFIGVIFLRHDINILKKQMKEYNQVVKTFSISEKENIKSVETEDNNSDDVLWPGDKNYDPMKYNGYLIITSENGGRYALYLGIISNIYVDRNYKSLFISTIDDETIALYYGDRDISNYFTKDQLETLSVYQGDWSIYCYWDGELKPQKNITIDIFNYDIAPYRDRALTSYYGDIPELRIGDGYCIGTLNFNLHNLECITTHEDGTIDMCIDDQYYIFRKSDGDIVLTIPDGNSRNYGWSWRDFNFDIKIGE